MVVKARFAPLVTLAFTPALVIVACHARTLDVGNSDAPDAARIDSGPSNEHPDVVTEPPTGFFVDGVSCPDVVVTGGSADGWPTWALYFQGACAQFGDIAGYVSGRADLVYPQACSVAVSVAFNFSKDSSDAGVLDFVADIAQGACSLLKGPSMTSAATPLAFDATLARHVAPFRTHHVTYNGRSAANTPPDDAGNSDVSVPPPPTCDLHPEGSRPAAVTCASGSAGVCHQDSECGTAPCECDIGKDHTNVCLSNSNCRVDADCGSGQHCARSFPHMLVAPQSIVNGNEIALANPNQSFDEALGYFCTTPSDSCCPPSSDSGNCVYDWKQKHWGWGYAP